MKKRSSAKISTSPLGALLASGLLHCEAWRRWGLNLAMWHSTAQRSGLLSTNHRKENCSIREVWSSGAKLCITLTNAESTPLHLHALCELGDNEIRRSSMIVQEQNGKSICKPPSYSSQALPNKLSPLFEELAPCTLDGVARLLAITGPTSIVACNARLSHEVRILARR